MVPALRECCWWYGADGTGLARRFSFLIERVFGARRPFFILFLLVKDPVSAGVLIQGRDVAFSEK